MCGAPEDSTPAAPGSPASASSGATEQEAVAAVPHHTVEDGGGRPVLDEIRRRYGDAVADTVAACSDAFTQPKPQREERKRAHVTAPGRRVPLGGPGHGGRQAPQRPGDPP
jgi:hypothetical protein